MLLPVLALSFPVLLSAQGIPDSLGGLHLVSSLQVPDGARYLDVDEEGNIFVTFPASGMLRKYLAITFYDSVIAIGGRGGKGESFNYPTIVHVQNRQNTWVLDQGSGKLVVLNTNLKVVGTRSFMVDNEPIWPQSFSVMPTGEFVIANALDNKIYKFTAMGTMAMSFGGLDMGDCNLYGPSDLMASGDGYITVCDTGSRSLIRFDLFGGCSGIMDAVLPEGIRSIHAFPNGIMLWGPQLILIRTAPGTRTQVPLSNGTPPLLSAAAMGNQLFLLFPDRIAIYAP